jgi:hypothetical protein
VRKFSKRKIAATIAITAILVGGGGAAAIAYWSTTGIGSGSAVTASATSVSVNQTAPATNLVPGGAAVALSGTFNNTSSGPVNVTKVVGTITGTDKTGCLASDYTLSNAGVATIPSTATPLSVVPGSPSVTAWSGLTISMANTALNQDACKGATVSITYAVS